MKKFIIMLPIVLVFLICFIYSRKINLPENSAQVFPVRRGNLKVTVKKRGMLSPIKPQKINPGIERNIKISYFIKEGIKVEKNQVVARFDTTKLKRDIIKKEKELVRHQNKLELYQIEFEMEQDAAEFEITGAKLAYQTSVNNWLKYKNFEAKHEKRRKQVNVEQAAMDLAKVKEKIKRLPELVKEGLETRDQLAKTEIELQQKWRNFIKAQGELRIFNLYTRPMESKKKKNEVKTDKSTLLTIKKRQQIKQGHKQRKINDEKMEIKRISEELAEWKQLLEKYTVRSPVSGIVIYGDIVKEDNTQYEVGEEVLGNQVLMTITGAQQMAARLSIGEDKVYLLRKGNPCIIRIAGTKNVFPGEISKIAEISNDESLFSTGKKFAVEAVLKGEHIFSQPLISVEVEMEISLLKNVLFVPKHTIKKKLGKDYCDVVKNGQTISVEVQVGNIGENYTEIRSGLKEGEKISLGF